jgi:uncharacterized protein
VLDIYIDADGCPVKEEVYRVAARYGLRVYLVANKPMHVPLSRNVEMIVVHGEFVIMPPWASEIIRDNVLSIDMTSASRTH